MRTTSFSKTVQNSRGMISAEFLFSLVLCAGLCIVLFSLNFTLSMAEVAQYIAYSAARAHAAGHVDQDKQIELGRIKFDQLKNNSILKPLFNNPDGGWFQLGNIEIKGGGTQDTFEGDYPSIVDASGIKRAPHVGVRFKFTARLLDLKIPFLGNTTDDSGNGGFSANITAFLIREPTQSECWDLQVKPRYSAILDLDSRYKLLGASGENKYVPMEDNGC